MLKEEQKTKMSELIFSGPILGIFAHPDDESFAAGGFLALASKFHPVYILTLTAGEAGISHSGLSTQNLGEIRKNELEKACQILGVSPDLIYLAHLPDGRLREEEDRIRSLIIEKISQVQPAIVLTIHPSSTTHPDHKIIGGILIHLKNEGENNHFSLYLQFLSTKYVPQSGQETFTLKLDPELFERKVEAVRQHLSQQPDINRILPNLFREENFIILK